jgi:hypothetical protein
MTDANPESTPLPGGRFEGRQAFISLVRQALQTAAREGWTSLVLSDADFADWPLGERAVVDALSAWAGRGRHLRLLAQDFGPIWQLHPRFVQWRVTWAHLVEAHALAAASAGEVPSAIWSPGWMLERLDPLRCVGVTTTDGARRVALRERLDSAWLKGSPSFAPTTLGL